MATAFQFVINSIGSSLLPRDWNNWSSS